MPQSSRVWLDPVILTWHTYLDASSAGSREDHRRGYLHWQHAADAIEVRTGTLDRIDVITTLKRAINHRLRLLKEVYQLNSIPLANAPKGDLQLLEHLGIAGRALVHRLIDIRNRVEHADADPPDVVTCRDLVEVTWYFLRSTDMLAVRTPTRFDLEWFVDVEDGQGAAVSVMTGPHADWITSIHAVLPPSLLSRTARSDWIAVDLQFHQKVKECRGRSIRPWCLAVEHVEEGPPDYEVLKGVVPAAQPQLLAIYKLYFEPMF